MKLIKVTWQMRNDFEGILQCEHCGKGQKLKHGYDDYNYHNNVIPMIRCKHCGKNRNGDKEGINHYKEGIN